MKRFLVVFLSLLFIGSIMGCAMQRVPDTGSMKTLDLNLNVKNDIDKNGQKIALEVQDKRNTPSASATDYQPGSNIVSDPYSNVKIADRISRRLKDKLEEMNYEIVPSYKKGDHIRINFQIINTTIQTFISESNRVEKRLYRVRFNTIIETNEGDFERKYSLKLKQPVTFTDRVAETDMNPLEYFNKILSDGLNSFLNDKELHEFISEAG